MYGLPHTTEIRKQLSKKQIFDKFELKSTRQEKFDADISKIFIVNYISPNTIPAVAVGEKVASIYVVQVILKKPDFDSENILLLNKLIPQKMVMVLEFEDQVILGIHRTRMVYSKWMKNDEVSISLKGTNLDVIWDNLTSDIGDIEIEEGNTVETQIAIDDARQKLINKIEILERKSRTEKQARRKLEMFEEIKKLKRLLNE